MKRCMNLDGIWKLTGFGKAGEELHLNGQVPGQVHMDLLREGIIPDPFYRMQAEQCQWVEEWTWEYERTFTIGAEWDLEKTALVFEGIDTFARILINDKEYDSSNMYLAKRIPAADCLRHGSNRIRVRILPCMDMVADRNYADYDTAFTQPERLFVRRITCTFYWDWVNRFVTAGIWRSVKLVEEERIYVQNLFVYTADISETSASLKISFDVSGERKDTDRFLAVIKEPEGKAVWQESGRIWAEHIALEADLEDPQLWWPNGYGDHPLYTCEVQLADGDLVHAGDDALITGSVHTDENAQAGEYVQADGNAQAGEYVQADGNAQAGEYVQTVGNALIRGYASTVGEVSRSSASFGIRTVRIEQLQDSPGSAKEEMTDLLRKVCEDDKSAPLPGKSFYLLVNGVRIFCKGANWVPADPFPAAIEKERYEKLLSLAVDAHMNLLRCWGGGIYEPEEFFDFCDRSGLMISQDFMMACGEYPEDQADFREHIRAEVMQITLLLRNHPSLVWWCGDNENSIGFDFDDPASRGRRLQKEIFQELMPQLDPSRPFRMTSPYGGRWNNCPTIGDCHRSFWMDYASGTERFADYREYVKLTGRFMSESVVSGMPSFVSLRKFLSPEDLQTCDREMMDYHTKNNPHLPPGYPRLYELIEIGARRCFGPEASTEEKLRREEYIEYEWVRLSMEAARRNRFYTGGIQYWMYNDCWPAVGWSLVDYYAMPKAGYYAFRQAASPVAVSFDDGKPRLPRMDGSETRGIRPLTVVLLNDTPDEKRGTLTVRCAQLSTGETGVLYQGTFTGAANANTVICRIEPAGRACAGEASSVGDRSCAMEAFAILPYAEENDVILQAEIEGEGFENRTIYTFCPYREITYPAANVSARFLPMACDEENGQHPDEEIRNRASFEETEYIPDAGTLNRASLDKEPGYIFDAETLNRASFEEFGNTPDMGIIELTAEGYARVVTIEGELDLEDNYFELFPGETRRIKYRCRAGFAADNIKINWWNR